MTLGDELKRRREEAGIDLSEIADATCIGVRFLRAIEDNDFKALPGGLFTRSFIRSYARYVDMDEDAAIRLYFQQTGEGESQEYDLTDESLSAKARTSMWANLIIALAVIVVLALGGFAGWHYWKRGESSKQASLVKNLPTRVSESTEPTSDTTTPPATSVVEPQPPPVNPESQPTDSLVKSEPTPRGLGETRREPSDTESSLETPQTKPVLPPPSLTVPAPSAAEPIPRPTQLEMSIRAIGDCSIYVQTDANMPRKESLQEGDRRVFTAKEKLVISAQNASNLNITINGHPVQLPPSGSTIEGVIITPQNLARFIKEQPSP